MDITPYLERQWREHAAAPGTVAATFDEGFALLPPAGAPGDAFNEFARLVEHVLLGHLGDVPAFERRADALEAHPADDAPAAEAKARLRFARAVVRERPAPVAATPLRDAARMPAAVNAALALVLTGRLPAANAVLAALAAELRDAGTSTATAKAIASATSTLTFHLQHAARPAGADDLMVDAALVSREAWEAAGTWLEIERAEYFAALACAAAGRGARALDHARRCEAICGANGDDPYEGFFAGEALVRAGVAAGEPDVTARALAAMAARMDRVASPESRAHCETTLAQVRALVAAGKGGTGIA